MTDQRIEFARSKNGYDPQDVDALMTELRKQIVDLKQQNASLSNTINQYNDKFRQLAENTKRLEEERTKEGQRLLGFMNQAAVMAEQTKQEALTEANELIENVRREAASITESTRLANARAAENAQREADKLLADAKQEAESIRAQAQVDYLIAQTALDKLVENTLAITRNNEQYTAETAARLAEINSCINNAKKGIPSAPLSNAAVLPSSLVPPDSYTPQTLSQIVNTDAPAETAADGHLSYEEYAKKLMEQGQQPAYQKNPIGGFPGDKK